MSEILIVNSMCGRALAIATILENAGYSVLLASNAQEARVIATTKQPSLILIGKTKEILFHEITTLRLHPTLAMVPIILETEEFSLLNEAYRSRLNVSAIVSSPVTSEQLLKAVGYFLKAA